MHASEDSIVREFIEESVHFQTEDVLTMYAIIFVALSILCGTQLYLATSKKRKRLSMINGNFREKNND